MHEPVVETQTRHVDTGRKGKAIGPVPCICPYLCQKHMKMHAKHKTPPDRIGGTCGYLA